MTEAKAQLLQQLNAERYGPPVRGPNRYQPLLLDEMAKQISRRWELARALPEVDHAVDRYEAALADVESGCS